MNSEFWKLISFICVLTFLCISYAKIAPAQKGSETREASYSETGSTWGTRPASKSEAQGGSSSWVAGKESFVLGTQKGGPERVGAAQGRGLAHSPASGNRSHTLNQISGFTGASAEFVAKKSSMHGRALTGNSFNSPRTSTGLPTGNSGSQHMTAVRSANRKAGISGQVSQKATGSDVLADSGNRPEKQNANKKKEIIR